MTALHTEKHGLSLNDRLVGYLPDYAPIASRLHMLANSLQSIWRHLPVISMIAEKMTGFSARRSLPKWSGAPFTDDEIDSAPIADRPVLIFADTFNRYFEPDNLRAAVKVLKAAGYQPFIPPANSSQPFCCGRTYLSVGKIDKARAHAQHLLDMFAPLPETASPLWGLSLPAPWR